MVSSTKQLYLFLTACSGNWRNTIHISCQGETDGFGYLLAADRDGQQVILPVQRFYELTGVQIDPAECCCQITTIHDFVMLNALDQTAACRLAIDASTAWIAQNAITTFR